MMAGDIVVLPWLPGEFHIVLDGGVMYHTLPVAGPYNFSGCFVDARSIIAGRGEAGDPRLVRRSTSEEADLMYRWWKAHSRYISINYLNQVIGDSGPRSFSGGSSEARSRIIDNVNEYEDGQMGDGYRITRPSNVTAPPLPVGYRPEGYVPPDMEMPKEDPVHPDEPVGKAPTYFGRWCPDCGVYHIRIPKSWYFSHINGNNYVMKGGGLVAQVRG